MRKRFGTFKLFTGESKWVTIKDVVVKSLREKVSNKCNDYKI